MLGGSWTGNQYAGQVEQNRKERIKKIGMKEYTILRNNKQQ